MEDVIKEVNQFLMVIHQEFFQMFDVVDDMLSPIYNLGDTVLAQFLDNKPIKTDGNYLLKLKESSKTAITSVPL